MDQLGINQYEKDSAEHCQSLQTNSEDGRQLYIQVPKAECLYFMITLEKCKDIVTMKLQLNIIPNIQRLVVVNFWLKNHLHFLKIEGGNICRHRQIHEHWPLFTVSK